MYRCRYPLSTERKLEKCSRLIETDRIKSRRKSSRIRKWWWTSGCLSGAASRWKFLYSREASCPGRKTNFSDTITFSSRQCCGSWSGIRCLFYPGIRDRFFPDPGSRIPNPYFLELSKNFFGKNFYNSLKIGPEFLRHFKFFFNFVKFVATVVWQQFFFALSFFAVFGYGIRDKLPGSATLQVGYGNLFNGIAKCEGCPTFPMFQVTKSG